MPDEVVNVSLRSLAFFSDDIDRELVKEDSGKWQRPHTAVGFRQQAFCALNQNKQHWDILFRQDEQDFRQDLQAPYFQQGSGQF
jgi:hypothetical protein